MRQYVCLRSINFGFVKSILSLAMLLLMYQNACAQDLEPRRWTPIPLGTHALGAGYSYSTGDVFFDPLLDIEDVEVRAHSFIANFVLPVKIANKLGTVSLLVPYSIADWNGLLSGESTSVNRTGFADPRLRASLILKGPPAGNAAEIRQYRLDNPVFTSIGVSMAIWIPIGEYFEDKLLNLGGNRFVFRPQVGMIHYWGKWSFELTGSVFIYTRNTEFFNNSDRAQRPTFAMQSHLVKQFNKGSWLSLSAGYGFGGESIINGQAAGDFRSNLLVSASYSFLIAKRQGLKLTYLHTEALENIGADTDNFILAWFISF